MVDPIFAHLTFISSVESILPSHPTLVRSGMVLLCQGGPQISGARDASGASIK